MPAERHFKLENEGQLIFESIFEFLGLSGPLPVSPFVEQQLRKSIFFRL